jgi:3',5'-cyclic AMP phosphodiesterase CpdA
MHLTIAHLSDIHLAPLVGLGVGHVNLKRALGLANWLLKRRHVHLRSVVDRLVADLQAQAVDHIVVSGDLTNLGLPGEHAHALEWLRTLGPPERVSVVPGNHDIYCRLRRDPGVERWRAYMTGDLEGARVVEGAVSGFPYVRIVGGLALIGVNSAVPTRPGEAIGEVGVAQLEALGRTLARLAATGRRRLVVIHHPPLPGQADSRRGLRDAARLEQTLVRHGPDLVIHGHNHIDMNAVRRTPDGRSMHVVGIASASIGRAYKHEPLGRYNLIRLDPAARDGTIEIVSRGIVAPDGPVVDVGRRTLAAVVPA